MQQQEIEQIQNIISNFEEKKAYIPYFSDLAEHEMFGPIFRGLSADQAKEVETIIHNYIKERIETMSKTK
ncbi:hypothetical protein KKG31_06330 [Patescibacteria group bacterium]|nr:hypothetical protein [Patescibacteria group bacterium]MBU1758713.1 hypothetical protein [Patescibacteria group bacterium]